VAAAVSSMGKRGFLVARKKRSTDDLSLRINRWQIRDPTLRWKGGGFPEPPGSNGGLRTNKESVFGVFFCSMHGHLSKMLRAGKGGGRGTLPLEPKGVKNRNLSLRIRAGLERDAAATLSRWYNLGL